MRPLLDRVRPDRALPPGTLAVGASLIVAGLTSYGFLVVAARALGKEEYAPLSVLWALVILVGPGVFLPLEQEISRALAARRAHGDGGRPVVMRALGVALILLAGLLVTGAALAPLMSDRLFDGSTTLMAAFLVSLLGYCASHVARGVLSGNARFSGYARHTGGESASRFLICVALALAGVTSAGPYGLAIGVAPLIGVALALVGERSLLQPGAPAPWSEICAALGALLAGSLLSFTLVNVGPLSVKLLATDQEAAEAGRFLVGLVVARVPLYLFQAVQAALLPRLSELASLGDLDGFRRGLGRLVALLGLIAVVGAVAAAWTGPGAVRLLFGDEYTIGGRTMALLAASSGLFMVATAVGQANIALSAHLATSVAWSVGVASFAAAVAVVSDDLFLRVELASIVGCGAALAAQLAVLWRRLRTGARIEQGAFLEAILEHGSEP